MRDLFISFLPCLMLAIGYLLGSMDRHDEDEMEDE